MNKIFTTSILAATLLINTAAANEYLNSKQPYLNAKEKHSLQLAKSWMNKDIKSYKGQDGSVKFIYGTTMPSIVTAPLRISDIQLQPGEIIKDIQIGDATRWVISVSTSGTDSSLVSHVIIKPTDVNLKTTLAIMTDRRTYHLNLVSRKYDYMPIVGFDYIGDIQTTLAAYKKEVDQKIKNKEFSISNNPNVAPRNIDTLNFNYKVDGNVSWKPIRVYNDSVKTYIQMPREMKFSEAPILMVLDNSNNNQIVNYRLKNDRFVVDKIFNKAVLMLGVGSDQEKVIISFTDSNTYKNENQQDALKLLTHNEDN
jgi:type IV secretion system protein TrbG